MLINWNATVHASCKQLPVRVTFTSCLNPHEQNCIQFYAIARIEHSIWVNMAFSDQSPQTTHCAESYENVILTGMSNLSRDCFYCAM